MDCGTLVLVGTVAAAFVFGGLLIRRLLRSHQAVQARPGELRALAQKLGLAFSERDPEVDEPLLDHTLYRFVFCAPANRLSGVVDGLQLDVFDSAWHTGGRTGHYRSQLVVVFSSPTPRWPRFVVQNDWAASDPEETDESLADVQTVELGLEAFEEAYTVAAASVEAARPLFTPKLTAALLELAKAERALNVESCGNRLVLWREKDTIPVGDIELLLNDARQVRALFDEAAGGATSSSAMPGPVCLRCGAPRQAGASFCGACGGQYA
jgi:hypothetical protein